MGNTRGPLQFNSCRKQRYLGRTAAQPARSLSRILVAGLAMLQSPILALHQQALGYDRRPRPELLCRQITIGYAAAYFFRPRKLNLNEMPVLLQGPRPRPGEEEVASVQSFWQAKHSAILFGP